MLNRRKAMIGWLVYTTAKPIVKRVLKTKAKGAVPGTREASSLPNTVTILVTLGALAGALVFWRSRRSESGDELAEG